MLRNRLSQVCRALLRVATPRRLALTGYPLQVRAALSPLLRAPTPAQPAARLSPRPPGAVRPSLAR